MTTLGTRQMKGRRRLAGCAILVALSAAFIAGVFWLTGERMDSQTRDLLRQADTDYRAGRFEQAEAVYRQAAILTPKSSQIAAQLGAIALLGNRSAEAVALLQQAIELAPWHSSFWPMNASLKTRLAMAYYRQDQFAEASRLFHEAAGPAPFGPFRALETLSRHTALFAGRVPYALTGPNQDRIPFLVTDPLPVLPVSINGNEPVNFILDTGGAEIILDDGLAREVGAEMAGAFTGTYAGGRQAETGVGRVESVSLGKFTLREVPINALDVDPISSLYDGVEIKGVIGTRLLQHFLPTIDYPGGALILQRATPENLEALDQRLAGAGAVQIPFWLADIHYMLAWGQFNEADPALFWVDTGLAGKAFTALETDLKAAGITPDWSAAKLGGGGGGTAREVDFVVDRLSLGTGVHQVVRTNLPGLAIEGATPPLGDVLGFRVGGMISHAFFRDSAVTYDFARMRMILE